MNKINFRGRLKLRIEKPLAQFSLPCLILRGKRSRISRPPEFIWSELVSFRKKTSSGKNSKRVSERLSSSSFW